MSKRKGKKITDKMRLDFLEKMKSKTFYEKGPGPTGWTIQTWEKTHFRTAGWFGSIREAIDNEIEERKAKP